MNRYVLLPLLAVVVVSSLCLAPAVFGQAVQTGTIRGFVLDPSSAVIPNARVSIASETKLIARVAESGNDGGYLFQSLPPGTYELQIESAGFGKLIQTGIVLHSGDHLRVDANLKPSAVNTTVEVAAEAVPALNTVNANLNMTMPQSEFRDMLLPTNEATRAALFLPGAVSEWVQNGRPGLQLTMTVDGVNDGDENQGGSNWQFNPPIDAVSEFRVTQNNYTADLGRSSGVRLEFVTKSGTNQFHGTAYGFVRNEAFNAKNWGNAVKSPSRYQNYGYTVGGPIKKERIFFFWSNYYRRINNPSSSNVTWPTAAQHNGDFSAWLRPPSGSARIVKNPATGQAFPGNIIPASLIDPNAKAYLDLFYPAVANPFALSNNGYVTSPVNSRDNYYSPRFDFRVTDKFNMYMRAMYDNRRETFAYLSPPDKLHPDAHTTGGPVQSVTLAGTYLLRPSLLLDFQSSFMHADGPHRLVNPGDASISNIPGWTGRLLYPGANSLQYLPVVNLSSGYSTIARSTVYGNKWSQGNTAVNLAIQGSRHNIKMGFDEVFRVKIQARYDTTAGVYSFDGSASGDSLADFLLGKAFTFAQIGKARIDNHLENWQHGLYIQDEVKINHRLTVTAGLRWESDPPYGGTQYPQISRFVPSLYDRSKASVVDPKTGIIIGTPNNMNGIEVVEAAGDRPMTGFAPRISLAWAPWGTKTAIRAGYGLFFDHQNQTVGQLNSNPPYVFTSTLYNVNFSDPSNGTSQPRPLGLTTIGLPFRTPRTQKYSAGIQHEIKGWLAEVNYVGSFSTLQYTSTNMNQPEPNADVLAKRVSIDAVRPYPGFGAITWRDWGDTSRYNSLQIQTKRSLSKGLFIQANYTLSKLMASATDTVTDPRNRRYDAGLSTLDRPHIFRLAGTYQPQFFAASSPAVKVLLNGWQLSTEIQFLSGAPLGVAMQTDTAGIGRTVRPDWKGSVALPRTMDLWFDPQAFSAPAALAFGNSPVDAIRGPGQRNFDLGIFRNFKIKERYGIQYRLEAYNALNHFNLNNPGLSFGTPNLGRITGKAGPRNVQMGLKISF